MSTVNGKELIALKNQIVEHFIASNWTELGYMTDEIELIESHPRLLQSLRFGDEDYEGNILTVLKKLIQKNSKNWSIILDYVEDKTGDTGIKHTKSVSTHSNKTSIETIVFSPDPEIFKIPDKLQKPNLVSVMMSFKTSFNGTISAIRKTCEELNLDCKRADDIWDNNTIVQDIFDLIYTSKVVIADFTEKNPNVFYEVGIAHTLGKTVIPISQSIDYVPADLGHHRVLIYLPNGEGYKVLEKELTKRLEILFPNSGSVSF